jgi:hypothetical protein
MAKAWHGGIGEAWTWFGYVSGEANAQNRNQQGAWATSGNGTTIRCRDVRNGAALRRGQTVWSTVSSGTRRARAREREFGEEKGEGSASNFIEGNGWRAEVAGGASWRP